MKLTFRKFGIVVVGALAGALMLPSTAMAQSRANTLEFILPIIYSPSSSFNGQGGSKADLATDLSAGFGIMYNLNNHLQLGGMFTWNTRSYNATIVSTNGTTRQASGTLESSTLAFNATYYFMPSGVTPFVSGGIGSTFIDTNIPNGTGSTACWWDPWYGYICDTYTPTKTQTAVSYSAGAGMRFDLGRGFSVQGSYNKMWIDYSKSKPEIDGWKLDLVFRM
jgi:hypothetical protein